MRCFSCIDINIYLVINLPNKVNCFRAHLIDIIVYQKGDIVKQLMKSRDVLPKNVPGVGWGWGYIMKGVGVGVGVGWGKVCHEGVGVGHAGVGHEKKAPLYPKMYQGWDAVGWVGHEGVGCHVGVGWGGSKLKLKK